MISKTFAYHTPGEWSGRVIAELRRRYSDLKAYIELESGPSRERAVALTELETSAMWAIKSVVSNDPDSVAVIEESA